MKQELILLKGISCTSKSTTSKKYIEDDRYKVLSSDSIRKEYNMSDIDSKVFLLIENLTHKYLKEGYSVVIDATNLTDKRHIRYKTIADKHRVKYKCVYIVTHPTIWTDYAQKRIKTLWTNMTYEDILNLRRRQLSSIQYPLDNIFDEIEYVLKDIEIDNDSISEFKSYYEHNLELFVSNPKEFFKSIYENGLLKRVIPELYSCYGFDQNNPHHIDTVENHIFKTTAHYADNEERTWIGILHDIGKAVPGIKKDIEETGDSCYIGHGGASMELAILILNRLDLNVDRKFIISIVGRHMYLPHNGNLSQKNRNRIGEELYAELVRFREADIVR